MSITIAHLSDVHLGPIAGFSPRYWSAKRLLGYLNWLSGRRHAHRRDVLERILADLRAQAPDHVAITGDLVNIGLPQELAAATGWLERLGPAQRVSVVPGNHDIYARAGRDPGTQRWARYMASDAEGRAYAPAGAQFPFVRILGRVALVGVNSAVPTPPLIAWGRVGRDQLERLERMLHRLGRDGLFRLVLIHHPPLPGQAHATRGLRDAAQLEAALARCGAELVIHGHNHLDHWTLRPCAGGRLAVVGAPSASLGRRHKREPLARYNLYRIGAAGPRSVELVGRGLAEPDGPVVELDRRLLRLDAGHERTSCEA